MAIKIPGYDQQPDKESATSAENRYSGSRGSLQGSGCGESGIWGGF